MIAKEVKESGFNRFYVQCAAKIKRFCIEYMAAYCTTKFTLKM